MNPPIRIAMWSGPRNISTAMMRAFGNRADCAVSDEPFYGAYLHATGLDHPMREAVIASQPKDWREVAAALTGPAPAASAIWYQKHMTHHMIDGFGRDWTDGFVNAFLIRAPEAVLASYARKRQDFTLEEIGLPAQLALFERAADKLGHAPPVIEGADVLADPSGMLTALCAACGDRLRRGDAVLAGRARAPATASGRRPGTTRWRNRRASRRRGRKRASTTCPRR